MMSWLGYSAITVSSELFALATSMRCIVCFVTGRPKLLGSLDVLLGVPITVTLVSVAVVTEWFRVLDR